MCSFSVCLAMCKSICTQLVNIDEKLFLTINQLHNTFWDVVIYGITHEAFWIPLYMILLYLIVKKLQKRTWLALLAIAILITVCDQFASGLVKPWVQRLRPCCHPSIQTMVHVVGRHHGLYGFISSHAANTFGLATFVWLLLKPSYVYISLLFIWAMIVSYTRIYGGVHYPADVLVGAMSGLWWGWIMYRIYNGLCQISKNRINAAPM